jgi:hypothetical protein
MADFIVGVGIWPFAAAGMTSARKRNTTRRMCCLQRLTQGFRYEDNATDNTASMMAACYSVIAGLATDR